MTSDTPGSGLNARQGIVVLHVAETLPGGIAGYLNEVLPEQCQAFGIGQVHVLAPADHLVEIKSLPVNCLHGYQRTGRNAGSIWRLASALKRNCEELRPQVVHLHSSFAGAIGRLLGPRLAGRPRLIYCPHGWAFARDDKALLRGAYILVERLLARRAHAWVAVSHYEIELAKENGIAYEHAKLIYNGRSELKGTVEKMPLDGGGEGQINLLFAGRFDRQKGLDLLLEAIKGIDMTHLRLFVAGAAVLSTVNEASSDSSIVWLGWLDAEALLPWYRACDAVIMPSRWEGLPLVAVEAMREGKAVLASRVGGLPEVVDDGRTGKLFEPDVASIRQVIQGLSKASLSDWGAQGRLRYLEKFTARRMNVELSSLYRHLLSSSTV